MINMLLPDPLIRSYFLRDNDDKQELKELTRIFGKLPRELSYCSNMLEESTSPDISHSEFERNSKEVLRKKIQDEELLDFLHKMINFDPTKRPTADELLNESIMKDMCW